MPNVEMIDAALQSETGPKTFDELVPLLEEAGYAVEAVEGDMPMEEAEMADDMGPADAEAAVGEGMDLLEEIAPADMEPMVTGISGVMRDKTRTASKNALTKHNKDDY